MRNIAFLAFVLLCAVGQAHAQNLVGTWQGTAGKIRNILEISKDHTGQLQGELYILDLGDVGINAVSSITITDDKLTVVLDTMPSRFEGVLAPDGKSFSGAWYTGDKRDETETLVRATDKTAWPVDTSPHRAEFITVNKDVRLEVLDWGGSGPPMVFLSGLGNTAHVFDAFAPKFTDRYHVYGITRRGFVASSAPPPTDENYDPNRLADDVLAMIKALDLSKPVLVGHSIAGQELSSIGIRYPDKITALVYLDAAMTYAFYDPTKTMTTVGMDAAIVRRILQELPRASGDRARGLAAELEATLPHLVRSLPSFLDMRGSGGAQEPPRTLTSLEKINAAIIGNQRPYMGIEARALVVYALAPCGEQCDSPRAQALAASKREQMGAVEAGMPNAHVVRTPNADHYVFHSNESDVLREMNAFLTTLK